MTKPQFPAAEFSKSLVDLPMDLLESEEIRLLKHRMSADSTLIKRVKLELIRAEIRARIKNGAIKSTTVNQEFVDLCTVWHNGQNSMLYAVSSTGNVKLGTQRPFHNDAGRPMTNQEWHLHLWMKLRLDFIQIINFADKPITVEKAKELLDLLKAKEFCDKIITDLNDSYEVFDETLHDV